MQPNLPLDGGVELLSNGNGARDEDPKLGDLWFDPTPLLFYWPIGNVSY